MGSCTQKMWASAIFTYPENVGEYYFHVPRKCGRVVFSPRGRVIFLLTQKMWGCAIFTHPENVGACFSIVTRGRLQQNLFSQKVVVDLFFDILITSTCRCSVSCQHQASAALILSFIRLYLMNDTTTETSCLVYRFMYHRLVASHYLP